MPNYCLGQALSDMVTNNYYKGICAEDDVTREFCKTNGISFQDIVVAIQTPGVGRFIIAMLLQGFVFLIGLYILESGELLSTKFAGKITNLISNRDY